MDVRCEGGHRKFLRRASLALVTLAAGWLMIAAPARAAHLEWKEHDQSSGIDLAAVSNSGGDVVAVGHNDQGDAVVLRSADAGVSWVADRVVDPGGFLTAPVTESKLDSVAAVDGNAWAVGTYAEQQSDPPNDTVHPLVLRLAEGASLSSSVRQDWQVVDTSAAPDMGTPTVVALGATPTVVGLIGDDSGQVFEVATSATPSVTGAFAGTSDPAAAEITGIALSGSGGFAVGTDTGEATDPGRVRIYAADVDPSVGWTGTLDTLNFRKKLVDVAMASPGDAIAVEEGGSSLHYWEPSGFLGWQRSSGPSFGEKTVALSDVAMLESSATSDVTAVAGNDQTGNALVWQRRGSWDAGKAFAETHLNGVTIVSEQVAVAVGDDGAVKRLAPGFHAPENNENENESGGESDGSGGGGSGGGGDPEVETEEQNDPLADEPRRCTRPRLTGQNVTNIRVKNRVFKSKGARKGKRSRSARRRARIRKRFAGRLIIKFRLQRKARVQIRAVRDGKIVGKTRRRVLRRGGHQMRLLYRKPPEKVQIKARLVRNCNNK